MSFIACCGHNALNGRFQVLPGGDGKSSGVIAEGVGPHPRPLSKGEGRKASPPTPSPRGEGAGKLPSD